MSHALQQPTTRRLALTGAGLTGFMALLHAANDALATILSALLPSIQDRFDLTASSLAPFVALLWLSSSASQPIFGALADRVGRRALAAGGIVASSALLSLVGVVPDLWLLGLLLVVGGLGSGALHPVGASLAAGADSRRRDLAVGLFSAGGMVGYALGPVAILFLVSSYGLDATPWLVLPGLVLGALVYLVVPADVPHQRHEWGRLLDLRLLARPLGGLVVAGVLADLAFITLLSALPLWLVDQGEASDSSLIGWALALFSLGAGAGSVVAGALATRYRRDVLVPATMVAAVVPLILSLQLPVGGPAFLAAVMVAGTLVYASFPLIVVAAQDVAPRTSVAAAGMVMGLSTGIAGALYIGVGALQDAIGLTEAMITTYLLLVPAAAIAYTALQRRPGPRSTEPFAPAQPGSGQHHAEESPPDGPAHASAHTHTATHAVTDANYYI